MAFAARPGDPLPGSEDDALRAMAMLLRKLRADEPKYEDEDVVSPHAAPSHLHRMDTPPHPGMPHREEDAPSSSNPVSSSSGRPTTASGSLSQTQAPPTPAPSLSFTAQVARFNAAELRGTRKAVIEVVRLLKSFHAIPWSKDTRRKLSNGVDEYRRLMDPLLHSFLVYANVSPHVRMAINHDIVMIARDVCLPMRQTEVAAVAASQSSSTGTPSQPTSRASPSPKRGRPAMSRSPAPTPRTAKAAAAGAAELPTAVITAERLERFLKDSRSQLPTALVTNVVQTFALEQMLDSYLPPAVCSSRFDGVLTVLHERKAALVLELSTARPFLAALIRARELLMLSRLVVMCAYAIPKVRIRVYDRLVAEGLMRLLRDKLMEAKRRGSHDREEADICIIMEILCFVADPNMDGEARDVAPPQVFLPQQGPASAKASESAPRGGSSAASSSSPSGASRASSPVSAAGSSNSARGRLTIRLPSRCVSWCKADECAAVVRISVGLLIDRERLSTAATSKIVEFLSEVVRFDQTTFGFVVDALHDAFDQIFCHDVSRVLPLVVDILNSEYAASKADAIETWFSAILVHTKLPQVRGRHVVALSKREVQYCVPFMVFAGRVATAKWSAGTGRFFDQMMKVAGIVASSRAARNNLAYGVAFQCQQVLATVMSSQNSSGSGDLSRSASRAAPGPAAARSGSKRGRTEPQSPAAPPPSPLVDDGSAGRGSFVWIGAESELPHSPSPVNLVVPWRDRLPFRLFGLSRPSMSPENSQESD